MSLIEQINLFHFLNLQPLSKKEIIRWEKEVEKYLIDKNKIKECYVVIDRIKTSQIEKRETNSSKRKLRERKAKHIEKRERNPRERRVHPRKQCCSFC